MITRVVVINRHQYSFKNNFLIQEEARRVYLVDSSRNYSANNNIFYISLL